ncbi:MAG: flagellar brake protein [Nitrospira sp.]|nr:flagellar brake protein [Nitrospira sp.]
MKENIEPAPPPASFLTVGLALKLSFTVAGRKIVYGSTLLGWKESAWLICEWPSQLDWPAGFEERSPCVVSYLQKGRLIGYKTEICGAVTTPLPLLLIAYPRRVEAIHLRKHARVFSNEPVLVSRIGNRSKGATVISLSDHVGGLVKDLSAGGCLVALERAPPWIRVGSSIHLEFELPGLGHVTNLTGLVKSITKEEGNLIGVEFQFDKLEYVEYRGWGGSVRQAIWRWVMQKSENHPLL